MGEGGLPHKYLRQISDIYPLSMHGVGLSLGSADGISETHLAALKKVVKRYQPALVSEHLSWSHWNKIFLNDLLPIPYNHEALHIVVSNIQQVQNTLERQILIENPSAYLGFQQSDMPETEFLRNIVAQIHCGLLLDINNVYVSANNQHYSATDYIDNYPLHAVGEIHLAGHTKEIIDNETVLIDDHGSAITDEVWQLFQYTLNKLPHHVPVLIEWDTDIPELDTLVSETIKANHYLQSLPFSQTVKPAL